MSKRYGRTQKRKHLQKIAQIEREKEYFYNSNMMKRSRIERLNYRYNKIVKAILRHVDNSSLIPPEEKSTEYFNEYYKLPLRNIIDSVYPINESILDTSRMECVILELIQVMVKYEDFSRCAHLKIRTKKGGYNYYISRNAINKGDFDYLLEHIYKTCMYELPKLFKEGKL